MPYLGAISMSNVRQAQRAFDAGVLSLGLSIDGQESTRNIEYAKLAFQRASEWDPTMCDAWLGRAATGDLSGEVLFNLYRTSTTSLFREQRRLGLRPREMSGRFQVGQYIDYPLANFTEIWLAQACQLIKDKEFDEAERVLGTPGLRLVGVMAVAPLDEEPRPAFARLRAVSERVRALAPGADRISAGMSGDYPDAILEGATHLRIGTAITGKRPDRG